MGDTGNCDCILQVWRLLDEWCGVDSAQEGSDMILGVLLAATDLPRLSKVHRRRPIRHRFGLLVLWR